MKRKQHLKYMYNIFFLIWIIFDDDFQFHYAIVSLSESKRKSSVCHSFILYPQNH